MAYRKFSGACSWRAKHLKQLLRPALTATDLMIADVPVVISISHGDETLTEYEEVIDLAFTPGTLQGRDNMRRFALLKEAKGLSTESALFTLASGAVRDHAQQLISRLSSASKLGKKAQHELHLHVKRNGAITYRKLIKDA